MSISANLTSLNQVKSDIKSAITNMGVDMTDVPFTSYGSKISEIEKTPEYKSQSVSVKSSSISGGGSATLTFTFSNLSSVLGITQISGCIEYVWLLSVVSITGNVVKISVGNKRSAGGPNSTTITLTAIGI